MRPELLTHENIPKPLHTLSPRTIMGKKWWDIQRQIAYERSEGRCDACGIEKQNATFTEIVSLCHMCHSYVHCGRLYMLYTQKRVKEEKIRHIMERGNRILRRHRLKPSLSAQIINALLAKQSCTALLSKSIKDVNQDWGAWRLIFEGKSYYSKFKNEEEHAAYFLNE